MKHHPQQATYPFSSVLRRLAAAAALLALTAPAMAQYVWVDEKGIKQFSDRPPPPSTPFGRILKAPGKDKFDPAAASAPPPAADQDGDGPEKPEPKLKAPPTIAERNADFNKRKAEAAKAAEKSGEEAARKADLASNCEGARSNLRALEAGGRMSTVDKNGERGIMDDAARAEAIKKNKAALSSCK
ncbi:DUF4124 domain-containing protein [Oxalobacteraceae bacterium]|nr:DUF4124 domain-containing protein [Oxalobacteraceae bacterium]